jgi:hypothetical protein
MQVRARHVPSFLAKLALVLAASVVVAVIIEWEPGVPLWWSFWLWVSACVAAVAALLVGLGVDRRGSSIPRALLVLLMLLAIGGVVFLAELGNTP